MTRVTSKPCERASERNRQDDVDPNRKVIGEGKILDGRVLRYQPLGDENMVNLLDGLPGGISWNTPERLNESGFLEELLKGP